MPKVFISYSHDSPEHRKRVLALSERLRQDGIETSLDQYVNGTPPQKWPRWMLDQVDWADFVLLVCTETYYRRFRGHEVPGKGKGVDWEGAIITQEIYDQRSTTTKFVPVLFESSNEPFIPEPARGHTFYVVDSEENYQSLLDFLLCRAGMEPGLVGNVINRDRKTGVPLTFSDTRASSWETPQIAPSRLPRHGAERLFGRDKELADLDSALANPKTHVLSIVAWGGIGKTALVVEWMNRLSAKGWPGVERVFDWSFYSQGTREVGAASADAFIREALLFFGDAGLAESGEPADRKGARLAQLVAQRPTLLILDGLEPLQTPRTGELRDLGLHALLRGLARLNPGLCLITTRERVDDLGSGLATVTPERSLERLDDIDGARLLHYLGVRKAGSADIPNNDPELLEASRESGGHALTLRLLGIYLAEAHGGDVRRRDRVDWDRADDASKRNEKDTYGHAFKVMAAYETWLSSGIAREQCQLAILRLMGFFDRPADPGCLAALLCADPIPGVTEPLLELVEEDWNIIVNGLEKLGLLKIASYEPKRIKGYSEEQARMPQSMRGDPTEHAPNSHSIHNSQFAIQHSLDAHPLLREYFAERLRSKNSDAWREGHQRVYEHLKASAPSWPEGLDGLDPLLRAVYHGCQARKHEYVRQEVYWRRIRREHDNYLVRQLGGVAEDLNALANFFRKKWSEPEPELEAEFKASAPGMAGMLLRALGRLTEAAEATAASKAACAGRGDWRNAALRARHHSEVVLLMGEIECAIEHGTEGVSWADRSGDTEQRIAERAVLADAWHQNGCYADARRLFEQAEDLQRAETRHEPPYLESLWGYRFCDLLETEQRYDEAIRRANELSEWYVSRLKPRLGLVVIPLYTLILARCETRKAMCIGRDPPANVRELLAKAIEGIRHSGKLDFLPAGLLTRAWLRGLEGDAAGARDDLDEAWEIAERGPMKLHMADIHLHRARLFGKRTPYPWNQDAQGRPRGPKDDLASASKLIESCRYWHRKAELEDAESAAATWPGTPPSTGG